MFKKSIIIFLIVSFLGINSPIIWTVKAQTEELIETSLPSGRDLDSVLEQAPETFDNLAWDEVMVCSTVIYREVSSWITSAINVVLNPVCQVLGRTFSFLGIGGTVASGECDVNAGGADTTQACKEWVQRKKASLKAKAAELTKLSLRVAVKTFMDRLVSQTVDWISGRTTGEPQFVTNWRAFFGQVADEAFGRFIENSPFSALCEPFRYQVRISTQLPSAPPFPICTLSTVVNNIDAFYEDFTEGSWIAFGESSYPWNNSIGAYLMAQSARDYELAQARAESEKATQSGFKPTEYCVEKKINPATGEEYCAEKLISTPGETKSDITSKALTSQLEKSESYFLTSADLKNYATMIAQALISRLVKSAKEELIGGKWYGKGLLDLPKEGEKGPSLNLRYACKNYEGTKACEIDPNGPYLSKESCEAVCGGYSSRYQCDDESKMCVPASDGNYADYYSCSKNCYPCTYTKPPEEEPWCYGGGGTTTTPQPTPETTPPPPPEM